MARKPKAVDRDQVIKLARIGCTEEEIGDIVGLSQASVSKRFRMDIARARSGFRMSLRRAQYLRAVKDRSDTMLVHLGKVHLGQGGALDGGPVDGLLAALLAKARGAGEAGGDPGDLPG